MRLREKTEAIQNITDRIKIKGVPIDCRDSDEKLAKYIKRVLDEELKEDYPLGVIHGTEYDHCPKCNGIIGSSAYYCKRCGAYIRTGGAG